MANYEATRYNISAADLTGIQGVNTGIIIPWSSTSIPSGFLECDGSAVSRSTYAALFAVVGTVYGSGNGSTTFNLPDLRDDTVLGRSNTNALASSGGANTVTPTGNVTGSSGSTTLTTAQMPSHSHSYTAGTGGSAVCGGGGARSQMGSTGNTGGGGSHSHNSSATYTGSATSVLQPYLTLIYIIKT